MTCAHCADATSLFNARRARRDLRRYHRRGPDRNTRYLLDGIAALDSSPRSLVDIGSGVGAIVHELLGTGVQRATAVDASAAYLAQSRAEAQRAGYAGRVEYVQGDFVDAEPGVPEADVVTLDRVICCYPHMERLVTASAAKARAIYALSYPRGVWWVRVGHRIGNALLWLRRGAFRMYFHPPNVVHAVVERAGFERSMCEHTFLWECAVYRRA